MIGADILDKTGQNAFSFGRLREEPTWWQLDTNQRIHFDEVKALVCTFNKKALLGVFFKSSPSSVKFLKISLSPPVSCLTFLVMKWYT